MDMITRTKEFVKSSFMKNPHYCFNHWSVMHRHSLLVEKIALRISKNMDCDSILVSIGALLHDIGKTYKADATTLHKYHQNYNWMVSRKFVNTLDLSVKSREILKQVVSYKSDCIEARIIRDADALALFADRRLRMLWIEWAVKSNLKSELARKLGKYEKLNFEVSRRIGKKWFESTIDDWKGYLRSQGMATKGWLP